MRRHFRSHVLSVLLAFAAGLAHAQPQGTAVQRLGDTIIFNGPIDFRSAESFLNLLQGEPLRRVVITSPGGMVVPALDMAEAIYARGLDVEVPHACLSSCANYIFPAGRRKLIGRAGVVAWHGNMAHVVHLHETGQATWSEELIADARALARREAAFFARVGVDGFICWFGKIQPHGEEDFYSLSAEDMGKFGIRGITDAHISAQVQLPGIRRIRADDAVLASRPLVRLEE